MSQDISKNEEMLDEYDFSESQVQKNPYAKRSVTIRLDAGTIAYMKAEAERTGIPNQTLIRLYLRDCAMNKRQLDLTWKSVLSVTKENE